MTTSIPDKVVLVTGASRGIGKAISVTYSEQGWKVIAPSRSELDLSSPQSVEDWLKTNTAPVSVLINNAGENPIGPISELSLATWERNLMVNLTAPMLLAKGLAQGMKSRKWGRIVNVSSVFGIVSKPGRAPYTSSKTALIGFTRTAALEWGNDNVLVNAVCPGYVETDLTRQNNTEAEIQRMCAILPLGRLGQPLEIARAIYFLGSEENTFMTGQTLVIDGGFTAQ